MPSALPQGESAALGACVSFPRQGVGCKGRWALKWDCPRLQLQFSTTCETPGESLIPALHLPSRPIRGLKEIVFTPTKTLQSLYAIFSVGKTKDPVIR